MTQPSPQPPEPPRPPDFRTWVEQEPAVFAQVRRCLQRLWAGQRLAPEMLDDLQQEAALAMLTGFQISAGPHWRAQAFAFAQGVAINRLQSQHRLTQRAAGLQALDAAEDVCAQAPVDPDARDHIQQALRRMPAGFERTVLALRLRGWTTAEIAEFLGRKEKDVNTNGYSRGRTQFAEALSTIESETRGTPSP